jgi:hypothetical protein
MHATIRRFESVDQARSDEVVKQVDDTLVPLLSKLPGFGSYQLIDAGHGVMTSISCFDTAEQGAESTRVSAAWVRDQGLEDALPKPPRTTSGTVVVQKDAVHVPA